MMSTPAALSKLRVAELKERLEAQGLSTYGTKPILVTRLKEALNKSLPLPVTPTKSESEDSLPPTVLDTPKRRSKRLSVSETTERVPTPLKKTRVSETSALGERPSTPLKKTRVSESSSEKPSTPVRRSRRLSGDLPKVPEELVATPAVPTVETIEEDTEENDEESQKSPGKALVTPAKGQKSPEKTLKSPSPDKTVKSKWATQKDIDAYRY